MNPQKLNLVSVKVRRKNDYILYALSTDKTQQLGIQQPPGSATGRCRVNNPKCHSRAQVELWVGVSIPLYHA